MSDSDLLIDEADVFELDDMSSPQRRSKRLTDKELEDQYDSGEFHVVTEKNDFLLPQIIDFVQKTQWVNLQPEYQRRKRWDDVKKSRLIESLLMNVPIPPIFLYEYDLARYEVMDGQQRLNAIVEFYNNELQLKGLEVWTPLNRKYYRDCPPRIERGLDRRKLSAVILQAESERGAKGTQLNLRRMVFQRLNTGGEKLNPQELRNALYVGQFNQLIIVLSRLPLFTKIWGIPSFEDYERGERHVGAPRRNNTLYKTMQDCQLVLRFFAFREARYVKGSVRSILDDCMDRHDAVNDDTLKEYSEIFESRLQLAHDTFGARTFRLSTKRSRKGRLSSPLYDAVMIALDQLWARQAEILECRNEIRDRLTEALGDETFYEVVVGRPNTANAILARIQSVRELVLDVID